MIQFETLGTVDLRRDGTPVRAVLAQPRRLALLAYLVTARPRGYHSRDRLLGLFWPYADQERARNSLRQALHQLRRALGEDVFLTRGDREIAVAPAVVRCDAVAFDEAIEAGRPEDALRHFRGDFLPGFFLDSAPEAERFIEDERGRYRRAAVGAAWQLAGAEEARGDVRAAVVHARQAMALDPHNEAGLRRTLALLERAGERAAAVQLYEEFARRLEQDLELSPSQETLRQVERLRAAVIPEPAAPEASPPDRARAVTAADPGLPPASAGARRRRGPLLAVLGLVLVVSLGGIWFRRSPPEAPPAVAAMPAIAVLPFVNMSGDPANEYLSDGISEELMHALSRVPGLNVVGRTSAFAYKGKDVSVDSIGRALRAGHVLEGSARVMGSRVRIVATLVDTRSGYHVWSDTYDADLDDVLDVQGRISGAIVGALRPRFAASNLAAQTLEPEAADVEAHADLLRGLQALRAGGPEDYKTAAMFFGRAVARDSSYGRAHAALAGVQMVQAILGEVPRAEGYARAVASAERALELDPTASDAHGALGRIAQDYAWDYERADRHFVRAIELSPGSEIWYRQRARLLSILGRHDEAIALARRSTDLDPLAPGAHRYLGLVLYHASRYDDALRAFDRALALAPDHAYGLAYQSYVLTTVGRHADAVAATERALAVAREDQIVLSAAAAANAAAGDTLRARDLLARLEAQPRASPYLRAEVVVHFGDRERVFELLERAAAERDPLMIEVRVTPAFDPLREDPRMQRLLWRIGLQGAP